MQEELRPSCTAQKLAVMAKKELTVVIDRDSKERGRATSSREAVGGGADLKANEAKVEINEGCCARCVAG
jgi:hypothetical protein